MTNPNISIRLKEFDRMLKLGFVKASHFFYGVKNLHPMKTIVLILFELDGGSSPHKKKNGNTRQIPTLALDRKSLTEC